MSAAKRPSQDRRRARHRRLRDPADGGPAGLLRLLLLSRSSSGSRWRRAGRCSGASRAISAWATPPSSASASTRRRRSRPRPTCRSSPPSRSAGALAALLGVGIGAVVFRMRRLRGELFALLTLAVTFVDRHHHPQHADRRRRRRVHERGAAADTSCRRRPARSTCWASLMCIADPGAPPGGSPIRGWAWACSPSTTTRTWPKPRACRPSATSSIGLRAVGRHRGRGGRHPCDVCRLPHRGRHLRTHRAALCRADERAGRLAPLVRAGDRRHRHHRACSMPSSAAARRWWAAPSSALVLILAILWLPDGVVPAVQAWLKRRHRPRRGGHERRGDPGRAGSGQAADRRRAVSWR